MTLKYRKAVFVVGYAKKDKKIEYILLKRKLHWKGWEFPKGMIEYGEKKINTVKRELKEETGQRTLNVKKFNYSGKYKYHKMFPDRPGMIGQTFALYAAQVKKEKVSLDPKEHSGYKWVSFKQALKMLKFSNQKKSLRIVNEWLNRKGK